MKQFLLLLQAALFCYFGYLTVTIYLSLNDGYILFRPGVPEDWMLWILTLGCFGFALHSIWGLINTRKRSA